MPVPFCTLCGNADADRYCTRCGKPVCSNCYTMIGGKIVCKHCASASPVTTARQPGQVTGPARPEAAAAAPVSCPRCGSPSVSATKRGFALGRAVGCGCLAWPLLPLFWLIGIIAGLVGANQTEIVCLKCGYKWCPGKR